MVYVRIYVNIHDELIKYYYKLKVYKKKSDHKGRKVESLKTPDGRMTYWVPEIQICGMEISDESKAIEEEKLKKIAEKKPKKYVPTSKKIKSKSKKMKKLSMV